MQGYFEANPVSAWFMLAAYLAGVAWLVARLTIYFDKVTRAKAIRQLRRESERRNRHLAWAWCAIVADEPQATRRISQREWMLAAPAVLRELSRVEQLEECGRRG